LTIDIEKSCFFETQRKRQVLQSVVQLDKKMDSCQDWWMVKGHIGKQVWKHIDPDDPIMYQYLSC